MKIIILSVLGVVALVAVGVFMVQRTEAQETAMQDYEECLQERAGMSPSAYKQKFGYYPKCY